MSPADGRWVELGDGVLVRRHAELDLSVGLVLGDDACLVVDTRGDLVQGAELAAAVREVTRSPWTVVVTHAHWDHSFGTAAFLPADVWAHVDCRTELIAHGPDQRAAVAADYAEAGRAADAEHVSAVEPVPPNRLLTDRAELTIGGRAVALAHLGPGHTGHDVVVHVPDADVVFAGDLVEQGAPPAFEDSFPLAWPATVDGIIGLAPRIVVPGHGAPVDVSFVTTQRDELTAVAMACADMVAGRSSWPDAVLRSPYPPNVLGVAIDRVRSTHPEAGKPPIQGHHVRPNGR